MLVVKKNTSNKTLCGLFLRAVTAPLWSTTAFTVTSLHCMIVWWLLLYTDLPLYVGKVIKSSISNVETPNCYRYEILQRIIIILPYFIRWLNNLLQNQKNSQLSYVTLYVLPYSAKLPREKFSLCRKLSWVVLKQQNLIYTFHKCVTFIIVYNIIPVL